MLTVEQIVQETRQWSPEKVGELVGRLSSDLHSSEPSVESAWKAEIERRIEDLQSGKVQPLPLEESLAELRKIAGL